MDNSEIRLKVKELNDRADSAEFMLKSLSKESKEEFADKIRKIEESIKENRELAKLYSELINKS